MQKLSPYQTEIIALTLMHGNPDAAERLARTGTADLSYSLPSRARFRVNIFQQRGVYSIVMRVIPTDIPTFKSLGLPWHLAEIAEFRNGLVLVTGPTGSARAPRRRRSSTSSTKRSITTSSPSRIRSSTCTTRNVQRSTSVKWATIRATFPQRCARCVRRQK